jgi:hypothetical protein
MATPSKIHLELRQKPMLDGRINGFVDIDSEQSEVPRQPA